MSYDLMVFDPDAVPEDREGFMAWYEEQTQWNEDHSYDDPQVTTQRLRDWFTEMIAQYPPMNGPLASDDVDDPKVTDYSIGKSVIYAGFAWSVAESAYEAMRSLAEKHRIGFFALSNDDAAVWMPTAEGGYSVVHSAQA